MTPLRHTGTDNGGMSELQLSAERVVAAPAPVVYNLIADYQRYHRPGGFLPPAFRDFRVEQGGVGAGTVISFAIRLGGSTRRLTQRVSEPEPGRVLVEAGDGTSTTFTVAPAGQDGRQCRVRFDTRMQADGVSGFFTRLFGPRLLRPLYAEELELLDRLARQQAGQNESRAVNA